MFIYDFKVLRVYLRCVDIYGASLSTVENDSQGPKKSMKCLGWASTSDFLAELSRLFWKLAESVAISVGRVGSIVALC